MKNDRGKFLLAFVLSAAFLMLWNHFFLSPDTNQTAYHNTSLHKATHVEQSATRTVSPAHVPQRIEIRSPTLTGSLTLDGALIDDLQLNKYQESTDHNSPHVRVLSDRSRGHTYYAASYWLSDNTAVPNQNTEWTLVDPSQNRLDPNHPLQLRYQSPEGLIFLRTILIDQQYVFTVIDRVQNTSSQPVTLRQVSHLTRLGQPLDTTTYLLHEGFVGVMGDLGLQEYTYKAMQKLDPDQHGARSVSWQDLTGGFVGITDKYWATAFLPDQGDRYQAFYVQSKDSKPSSAGEPPTEYSAWVQFMPHTLAPHQTMETKHYLFVGPKEADIIRGYQSSLGIKDFDLIIDWGWFKFLTKPMFYSLKFFYSAFKNFGVAILVVTLCLKVALFPIANISYRSIALMKEIQPKVQAIQKKHGSDKLAAQKEVMELYRKEQINPLSGCLPMLIQIPIFFSLYKVLYTTIEMRHAPFFGWIKDLAAPDPTNVFNLFGLIPFQPPSVFHIGVWPILMGVTMYLQMKQNPSTMDPIQQRMMTLFPLVLCYMLAQFPSGLVIYWAWNNVLSIAQQQMISVLHKRRRQASHR